MKHALFAALCLTLLAGAAQAQTMGRRPDPDLNHDGKVTLAEFRRAQADAMLGRLDTDKDGKISKAETQAMAARAKAFRGEAGAQRVAAMTSRVDANHDGTITRAEIEAGAALRFATGDTNHDGWLSKGELLTLQPNRAREG
jgi:Ca2+-binding EF-hand superfamily protein